MNQRIKKVISVMLFIIIINIVTMVYAEYSFAKIYTIVKGFVYQSENENSAENIKKKMDINDVEIKDISGKVLDDGELVR